jgi:hypothetical protein
VLSIDGGFFNFRSSDRRLVYFTLGELNDEYNSNLDFVDTATSKMLNKVFTNSLANSTYNRRY